MYKLIQNHILRINNYKYFFLIDDLQVCGRQSDTFIYFWNFHLCLYDIFIRFAWNY